MKFAVNLAVVVIAMTSTAQTTINIIASAPMTTTSPYNLMEPQQADWVVFTSAISFHSYEEKANANAITVGGTGLGIGNGSQFTYNDGQLLPGLQTIADAYQYNGWSDIAVSQGTGRITVWLGSNGTGQSTFTAVLGGVQAVGTLTETMKDGWFVLDYSADMPGTVQIRTQYGTNQNVGMYAVALAVPEPATMLLLGIGGTALLRRRVNH